MSSDTIAKLPTPYEDTVTVPVSETVPEVSEWVVKSAGGPLGGGGE